MVKWAITKILPCILLLLCPNISLAQITAELNFITKNNPILPVKEKEQSATIFKETSEVKIACLCGIRLYQLFVSSQQELAVCNFTPSCSHFGMAAIKRFGAFYGILMTSDRIQRCNGFGRRYYPVHPVTGKSWDPIDPYYLKIRLW